MDAGKGDQRSEVKDSGKSVKADAPMDLKLNEVLKCFCCMLCSKLFEEATTIDLCLHTFCKKCIYQAVQQTKCCPQCKEDLGSSPEEHLKDDEKIQFLLTGKGQLESEANDVKQGAGTSKPPGSNNQFEDQEISGEKFHHKPEDAEKEHTLDRMSSQESSAFPTTASAIKVACSVSKTDAGIGKSKTEDKIKEHKKKKRSKNRRAPKLTPGETSKTEEKKADIGPHDIHKDEDAKDRESSTPEKQVLDEKPKEISSFWFTFVPLKGDKRGRRLPAIDKSYVHLKDSSIPVFGIQMYIAQKLKMNDHTEVDVVCCGEKLKGDMTLKDIQLIWMLNLPNSGRRKRNWDKKELMIELGYTRSEKPETSQKK
ncbi:hypothetical protein K7X08_015472 [Anisodus acutangulus]|uniref:RING-type domain-containing protein n=1 Tax=Anisodus acutangulus TaxID=402998 RepID=A0A9Q1L3G9_9SOLA|nr:hypothetical protein K7X08_015472 [Anisodus acutangulus]